MSPQPPRKKTKTDAPTSGKESGGSKEEKDAEDLSKIEGGPDLGPPRISSGMVDFSLSGFHDSLVCSLCDGYFKDPYTITECLHTFCKACLHYAVACGCHECPECKVYLGNDVPKFAVLDATIQELIDRVIFPDYPKKEKDDEKHFYETRGYILRPEYDQKKPANGSGSSQGGNLLAGKDEGDQMKNALEFTLLPEAHAGDKALPVLDCPCLHISGKFRMNQLKKYLSDNLLDKKLSSAQLEILCNSVPLGDEISLSFVKRLLWPYSSPLALTYRLADDEFE